MLRTITYLLEQLSSTNLFYSSLKFSLILIVLNIKKYMYCFLSLLFTVMSKTVKHSGLYISCFAGAVKIERSKSKKKSKKKFSNPSKRSWWVFKLKSIENFLYEITQCLQARTHFYLRKKLQFLENLKSS